MSGLCDPLIDAFLDSGDVIAYVAVDTLSGGDSHNEVDLLADASIIGTPQSGTAAISFFGIGSTQCNASAGSVTLTGVGSNGGRIQGNYTVSAWSVISGSCPGTPYNGSFNITRNDFQPFESSWASESQNAIE